MQARQILTARNGSISDMKFCYLSALVVFFAFVACNRNASENYEIKDGCKFFEESEELIKLELGKGSSVFLLIPEEYSRSISRGRYRGGVSETVLLTARIPDFGPFAEPIPKGDQLNEKVSVLIEPATMDTWTKLKASMRVSTNTSNEDLLAKHIQNAEQADHGLIRLDGMFGNDVFLNLNNENQLDDVIGCSQLGSVPYPGCKHNLVFADMALQLRYRRIHLEDWQSISRTARDFAACMNTDSTFQIGEQ